MLDSIPVSLVVGTALGFLSGLGVGGGSLLVLWLTVVLGLDPVTARGINLLFFLPSALVSLSLRRKQGVLKQSVILPAAIAGCGAAALLSQVQVESVTLKKLFGGLLIVTGIRELRSGRSPKQ